MALQIFDPRYVDQDHPKRQPIRESYWQRGCNDARAGRPYSPPIDEDEHDRRNAGYANGYNYAQVTSNA